MYANQIVAETSPLKPQCWSKECLLPIVGDTILIKSNPSIESKEEEKKKEKTELLL